VSLSACCLASTRARIWCRFLMIGLRCSGFYYNATLKAPPKREYTQAPHIRHLLPCQTRSRSPLCQAARRHTVWMVISNVTIFFKKLEKNGNRFHRFEKPLQHEFASKLLSPENVRSFSSRTSLRVQKRESLRERERALLGTTVHNGGSRAAPAARTPHHHALSCFKVTVPRLHGGVTESSCCQITESSS